MINNKKVHTPQSLMSQFGSRAPVKMYACTKVRALNGYFLLYYVCSIGQMKNNAIKSFTSFEVLGDC